MKKNMPIETIIRKPKKVGFFQLQVYCLGRV